MQSLPTNIYSVAAVREIDRIAIEDSGVPGYTLMTRAGEAAVRCARERFPEATRWQIVCGGGNNGGDGYVVARFAMQAGIAVSVVSLLHFGTLQGDAAKAYVQFEAAGGVVSPWTGELDSEVDLLVDAMLGSGLARDLGGSFAAAADAINAHPAAVHALDIASGINGDTGAVMGRAVRADMTTTFVGLKAGLFLGDGKDYCGDITFAGLGIGDECRASVDVAYRRIDDDLFAEALPRRLRTAHKGDFGHVLVVGGGAGMAGAARLCGEAALRAGAGRVSIATDPSHAAMMVATRPELMVHAVADSNDLRPLLDVADVVAFGPGLGRSDWAQGLFDALRDDQRPAVWDADALNWLASRPNSLASRVITPHPGEAATLLQTSNAAIQGDRSNALNQLAEKYGGTVVLKGAGSLISSDSGVAMLSTSGNPGMAAPGMGDALTGIIAALIAQGVALPIAAAVGVEIHARAGDRAALAGERGLIASDLIDALRGVVNP